MAKDNVVRNNIWKWLTLAVIAVVSFYVCNQPDGFRFGLDRELKPLVTDRGETAFSPVAGFLYTCAAAELPDGGSVTVRLAEAGE